MRTRRRFTGTADTIHLHDFTGFANVCCGRTRVNKWRVTTEPNECTCEDCLDAYSGIARASTPDRRWYPFRATAHEVFASTELSELFERGRTAADLRSDAYTPELCGMCTVETYQKWRGCA